MSEILARWDEYVTTLDPPLASVVEAGVHAAYQFGIPLRRSTSLLDGVRGDELVQAIMKHEGGKPENFHWSQRHH